MVDSADRLCALEPDRSLAVAHPSDEALAEAAHLIERDLERLRARGDPAAADLIGLFVPEESLDPPSDRALARYCAAAGEVKRLGANGSQAQAVNYLLAAFRRAEHAGDQGIAATAAYRLALTGASDMSGSGNRGAQSRSADGGIDAAPAVAAAEAAACDELAQVRLRAVDLRSLSILALECAVDRSLRSGDRRLAALANLRLSRLDGQLADLPGVDREALLGSARQRALATLPVALSLDAAVARAELTGRLIDAALDFGAGARAELAAAVDALRADAAPGAAALIASLDGRLALARGDADAARAFFQAAILAESRRPLPTRIPLHYLRLAQADPDGSARYVQAAYAALENLRPLLPRFDPLTEETSFALYMRDIFVAAVEAELAEAVGPQESDRIRRAQRIVEAYREAELQSAFGSECLPPRQAVRPEDLRPGEILLYPLLLPDRIELLYVAGSEGADGAPRYRRLAPNRGADRAEVAQLVEAMVLSTSAGGNDEWRLPARRLYDLLVAPLADQLGPGSTLAIVPDGPLRSLPFAALIAPDGRFLVQQTRLSLIPALAYSQPEGRGRRDRLSIVAASLQRQMNLPVGFFPELAGTADEARIAIRHAAAATLVPDFTRAELEAALEARRVDVLHLATHATFNGRSDRAFIVANGEVIRLSELREMIDRTRRRGEPLDLIVLSACETAVGDDQTSMGLAGAAVQAGARSVIGSLWQVSDTGTAELMAEFYDRYGAGLPRADALRDAQLALIRGGGASADPNVWAAFALLGAWR